MPVYVREYQDTKPRERRRRCQSMWGNTRIQRPQREEEDASLCEGIPGYKDPRGKKKMLVYVREYQDTKPRERRRRCQSMWGNTRIQRPQREEEDASLCEGIPGYKAPREKKKMSVYVGEYQDTKTPERRRRGQSM